MHRDSNLPAVTSLTTVTAAFIAVGGSTAAAAIVAVDLGLEAPPAYMGGYPMTPFPLDPRPRFEMVTSVPGPAGLDLAFDVRALHQRVDPGHWSHAYFGDVYWATGESLLITLPPATTAFYLYARPGGGGIHPVTVEADDGTGLTRFVEATQDGRGFGLYGTDGSYVRTLRVTAPGNPTVGEFGILIPSPASEAALAGAPVMMRPRRRRESPRRVPGTHPVR